MKKKNIPKSFIVKDKQARELAKSLEWNHFAILFF